MDFDLREKIDELSPQDKIQIKNVIDEELNELISNVSGNYNFDLSDKSNQSIGGFREFVDKQEDPLLRIMMFNMIRLTTSMVNMDRSELKSEFSSKLNSEEGKKELTGEFMSSVSGTISEIKADNIKG